MNNNYYKRFEFIHNPFVKSTNEIFIENENTKELKLNLDYTVNIKGIAVVVGAPGHGKTSAVKNYIEQLPRTIYKPIYMTMSTLTVREFYMDLADKLGIVGIFKKNILVKEIKEQIINYNDVKKVTPIIIIDEANYLNNGILNDLKMILNFNMDSQNKAILILIGLPNLLNTLELNMHQPLNQRVTSKTMFDSLTQNESRLYIETKIEKAGSNLKFFDPNAINGVINGSGGVPRIIDKILDRALMIADEYDKNIIDLDLIKTIVSIL